MSRSFFTPWKQPPSPSRFVTNDYKTAFTLRHDTDTPIHFISIFNELPYKNQQAINITVTVFHHLKTPWLKKHTWQIFFKFQNVKFQFWYSYIRILNENIWIWD